MRKEQSEKAKVLQELTDRGFTGTLDLEYKFIEGGWYCSCDQMNNKMIGEKIGIVFSRLRSGTFDYLLQ